MLQPGTQIGPYEIISLLGSGGMGVVYRARDTRLARMVALKVLPPDVAGDIGRRQRFEQEARAASALNHPNIVSVFDLGSQDGLAYIVSELIEGESLREIIRRGPLSQNRTVEIGSQVADALAAAHVAGIVHRDLKPENIMATRDGRAKILDFGLAKQVQARAAGSDETQFMTRTSPGAVLGTAGYMSPEQIRGEPVDPRSDIFSFGLVLYECLCGHAPFERQTGAEMMTAILREDPPELPETIAPALREIVTHCLEKEPERRFHSANDLSFALRTLSTPGVGSRGSGSLAAAVSTANGKAAPRPRKWMWPGISVALAAMLAAFAIPHYLELDPIDLAAYRFVPFANDHEAETGAAWSPDGKSIAYLKTVAGIPQLMVRALESPTAIQLTKSKARVSYAFWSPDSTVVYCINREGRGELWGVSPSGGHAAKIMEDLQAADLSPDGKTMALWRTTETAGAVKSSLWISSPVGATPRPYRPAPFETPLESVGNSLHFSPDGKSILVIANGMTPQIWVVPFPESQGAPRRVFGGMNFNFVPRGSWMPDSRHAVLSFSTGGSAPALWFADLKRESLRKLTASTAAEEFPSLDPVGRRLVFTSVTDDFDLIELPLDGSAPHTLLATSRNMYSPSWSPDGTQLLYATDRSGSSEIWIHNTKASIDRPIVTARDFPPGATLGLADPVFSPDGSRFAFVRYSTDQPAGIWVEPTVGGVPIRMANEYMVSPTWSPDGNSIAGLMHRERPWQPAIVEVGANMSPHVIAAAPTCLMPMEWSPAGDWLACEARTGIELFSPDGSKRKTLPRLNSAAIAFSRDGRTLYTAGQEAGHLSVKAIDVASGAVREIAQHTGDLRISGGATYESRLVLTPGGGSLSTSAVDSRSDLWLLEGFPQPRPWWRLWH
jgi:Tol biopolymer transport system component